MTTTKHSTINFLEDDVKDMTLGRRLALKLNDNRWYNPSCASDNEDEDESIEDGAPGIVDDFEEDIDLKKPSLKAGWAYFEHHTLYRYIVGEKGSHNLATPGENTHPTRLYHWFWTPHKELGDFGHGIGLYFSTLRYLIFVTIVAGLINLDNIIYFASPEYGGPGLDSFFHYLRIGSAICGLENGVDFVPCPDCECETPDATLEARLSPFPDQLRYGQCAYANSTDGTELTFAAKTSCDATKWEVIATNFVSIVFVAISLLLLGWYLKREQHSFDESEQTAQDFSIQIKNPPKDAKDPEEWRSFFQEKFGAHTATCTCAIPNEELLKTLVARRELLRKISELRPGQSLNIEDLARDAAKEGGKSKLSKLYAKLLDLNTKVKELSAREYPATSVFVTFESEEGQRQVLKALTDSSAESNDYLFRGEHRLQVREPEEPDTIRWLDLNTGFGSRMARRTLTLMVTVALLAFGLISLLLMHLGDISSEYLALLLSFYANYMPSLATKAVNMIESHQTETSKQVSIYIHNLLISIMSGSVFVFLSTKFEMTILSDIHGKNGLISMVSFVLFLNTVLPLLDLLDIDGPINRHIKAPRAKTQDSMNLLFRGEEWNLTSKYMTMMANLFLCTFFSSIFPTGYFYCAAAMILQYIISKRNLLRTCRRTLSLGTSHVKINRRFFFPILIAAMAFMSSLLWTGFPFDNLCERDENYDFDSAYVGNFTLTVELDLVNVDLQVAQYEFTSSDTQYRVCNQNFQLTFPYITFPYVPSMAKGNLHPEDYMTEDQLVSTEYFGWVALAIIVLCLLRFVWSWFEMFQGKKHGGDSKSKNPSQGNLFGSIKSKRAYIPEMNSPVFSYPLIGCITDGINNELFAFQDPGRSYKYYDLSVDVTKILKIDTPPACFTTVKSWQ